MFCKKLFSKPSILFIIAYATILLLIKTFSPYFNFISYDNFGYYMHLPAKYIYHDEGLKNGWFESITEKYKNTGHFSQTATTKDNQRIMRFYKGMSYLWIPPFFVGHLYAKSFGYAADGFSVPYHTALIFYGALFSIIGVIFSRKILLKYFNERITAITLFIFFTGTSFFYFSTLGSDVPHIYLFALISSLIYWTIKWHEEQKFKYILFLAISMGFIIAVRPSDMFIAIIPLLWGVYNYATLKNKLNLIYKKRGQFLFALLICFLFILPQLIYYYRYTGSPIINVYDNPAATLDLMHPRFAYVLVGFRKGWFIYSPLIILGFVGLFMMRKSHKDYFLASVIYFALLIYLVASFSSLLSFGWRAFLQSSALLVLPMGFFVDYLIRQKILVQSVLFILISGFIVLTVHQAYQIRLSVLDGSRMTRKYYFAILGKNVATEEDKKLMVIQQPDGPIKSLPEGINYQYHELMKLDFEDLMINDPDAPTPYDGKGMYALNKLVQYTPSHQNTFKNICINDYCYINITAYVYANKDISDSLMMVTNTKNSEGHSIKYDAVSIGKAGNKFIPGQWNKIVSYHMTPDIYSREENIESYLWYLGSEKIWIDDLYVGKYEPIE